MRAHSASRRSSRNMAMTIIASHVTSLDTPWSHASSHRLATQRAHSAWCTHHRSIGVQRARGTRLCSKGRSITESVTYFLLHTFILEATASRSHCITVAVTTLVANRSAPALCMCICDRKSNWSLPSRLSLQSYSMCDVQCTMYVYMYMYV